MKRLAAFILFMGIVSTACNKKETITNAPANDKLNTISLNYLNSLSSRNSQAQPMIFGIHISKKALRIIGADLGGALTGAAAGAGAGAAIAGVGAGAGAIAGGLIGGAAGSLKEAGKEDKKAAKVAYTPSTNSDNPYDNIGYEHYYAINEALSADSNYLTAGVYDNSLFYSFSTNLYVANDVISDESLSAFPLSSSDNVLTQLNNYHDSLVVYMNGIAGLDSVVKSCLTPYFNCFEASEDAKIVDFVAYSIQMENAVLNMAIADLDKQIILSVMATARYGSQYWTLQY